MKLRMQSTNTKGAIRKRMSANKFHLTLAATAVIVAGVATDAGADWSERSDHSFEKHPAYIYTPSETMSNGKHALMLVLHGCNQTAKQLKEYGNLKDAADRRGIVVVVPDVGKKFFGNPDQRCWDYDSATDNSGHIDELSNIVESFLAEGTNKIDDKHIYIVGVSSGGAMALDVACKRPDLFAGVGSVAGPSVGSNQNMAIWGPMTLPSGEGPMPMPFTSPLDSKLEDLLPANNVKHALKKCNELASGKISNFGTQIANIAVGEMDRDSPTQRDRYPFQPPIDQAECDRAGQIALVSYKWSPDNVKVLRNIYRTGELEAGEDVQDGEGVNRTAKKDGKARVSFLTMKNVGHAWPSGPIQATCTPNGNPRLQSAGVWIAHTGLDYPEFITNWLMTNNLRAGPRN